jgi:sulfite reductase beta subunit-like hemoprotein
VIAGINRSGLTTMGACGDVVRNIMGPAAPKHDVAHLDSQALAEEISKQFLWRSSAYCDIWLDGEKLDLLAESTDPEGVEDSLYGKVYLPRKFKMGVAVAPSNDVDAYSQDVGFVPEVVDGKVDGYTIIIGGGFGMSHGQLNTRPFLAQPFGYVKRKDVAAVTEAIVKTQRDHGNRIERKNARMKYLVEKEGIPWFIDQVKSRLPGVEIAAPKELKFDTVADQLGWHEQGDGKLYVALYVSMGRVVDIAGGPQYRSAFKELAETLGSTIIITPNTNIIFADIDPADKAKVDAILAKHKVPHAEGMTAAHQVAHACVALPTCGLSLAESERVFGGLMDSIDVVLRELDLAQEPILFRMTGCPNGCARPYNADIGFVGRGPGKYAMFVGGSISGNRLAGLETKTIGFDDIPNKVRELMVDFKTNRLPGERFTEYWARFRELGPAPTPEQFHIEFAERAAKLAGQSVTAAE